MFPILIYKIIFLLTAFGAGVIAVDVFLKREKRTIFELVFGFMSAAFVLWASGRFAFLFATDRGSALSWAHFFYNGSILVHVFFLHTILIYLDVHNKPTNKIILWVFYVSGLFLLIVNNIYFFTGQNYLISDVIPKMQFAFYEVPDNFYFLHMINYLFIPTYCFLLMLISFFKSVNGKKQQIKLVIFASIVGFVGGNSVVPLVYNIPFEPFLLIMVPFYLPILTYAIAKHKLFNIKVITTELLVFSLWAMILARIFLSENSQEQFVNLGLLIMTLVVGIFLMRGVYREVAQREKIENLAKDLSKANDRLKELDQLKSEFVSLASHQIRGPLTAIKGYASEIIEGDFGKVPDNLVSPIKTIFQSCESLVVIVEDFLNVSRIEQGRMKYDITDFSMGGLVAEVLNEVKPTMSSKHLKLVTDLDNSIIIEADRGKIKQILNNLVDNSIKYTRSGTIAVRVGKSSNGSQMLFSIKDTGIGISAKTMPKLFQKFSRAEDASKSNIMGTGLGLYVASEMIRAQGGSIWAESEGEGKGSTFFVELKAKN